MPDLDIPVGLKVELIAGQGDPDVYVCNRNQYPKQEPLLHTWKSQDAGDDIIYIKRKRPSSGLRF